MYVSGASVVNIYGGLIDDLLSIASTATVTVYTAIR